MLRIIGIILLCILGLFLALILLALFIPIPYRIYVNGDSGEPETLEFRVNVFGIQVLPKKVSSEKTRRPRKERRAEEQQHNDQNAEAPQIQAEEPKKEVSKKEVSKKEASKKEASKEKSPETADTHQIAEQTKQRKQKKGKKKTHSMASKNKAENTSGRDIRETLKLFYAEFTDEGNWRALRHLLSEICYLLRHFGPRRVRADVCFSLGDPANTGFTTAALGMCPFSYGKNCRIIPDFEAEKWYVQGQLDMRGHGRAVHLIAAGLRLLFDRDIRRIIRKILNKKHQVLGGIDHGRKQ